MQRTFRLGVPVAIVRRVGGVRFRGGVVAFGAGAGVGVGVGVGVGFFAFGVRFGGGLGGDVGVDAFESGAGFGEFVGVGEGCAELVAGPLDLGARLLGVLVEFGGQAVEPVECVFEPGDETGRAGVLKVERR